MNRRIMLAGGSGLLGSILAKKFIASGDEVVVLTRSPRPRNDSVKEVAWDGKSLGEWTRHVDGAQAVINLTGRSVDCRYHARNRKEIMESRVDSTRVLGKAIGQCRQPPAVWLNASTATIYKHSLDRPMDEAGEIGATQEAKDAFSVEVARAWEAAFNEARTPATRKVALRTAMVFASGRNSVFPVLRRMVRFGLGGKMASGRQFVSWIHEADFCRAIEWLLQKNDFTGAVNLAAPNPVTNREMMQLFRRLLGVRFGLPAPLWMLEAGAVFLRTETELIIKSRRVVPRRLLASGFSFLFPEMEGAVRNLESRLTHPHRPEGNNHAPELAGTRQ